MSSQSLVDRTLAKKRENSESLPSSQPFVTRQDQIEYIEKYGQDPSSLIGYLNFREYESDKLYDVSLSPQEENQKWKFLIGFLVKYEPGGKISPVIQVWEKYQEGIHCRKANLVFVNGETFKDMAKLTWRQRPEWTYELAIMIRESALQFIKNDYSEEYELEAESNKKLAFCSHGLLPVVKAHFDEYATKVFASFLNEHPYKKEWEDWEIPFNDTDFLLRSQCVQRGDTAIPTSPGWYPHQHLFDWPSDSGHSRFRNFLTRTSRSIAINAYPEFSDSVTNRDIECGDVYLSDIKVGS